MDGWRVLRGKRLPVAPARWRRMERPDNLGWDEGAVSGITYAIKRISSSRVGLSGNAREAGAVGQSPCMADDGFYDQIPCPARGVPPGVKM